MVAVFREVRRVLRNDGTLWLNLGDSYGAGGGKQVVQTKNASHGLDGMRGCQSIGAKQLAGIPWRVAFALQADGWYLRQDIIWAKPNPMPESVTDRCTKAHEYIFLLSKSERYYFDQEAIKEPVSDSQVGRIRDDVVGGNKGDETHHSPGGSYSKGKEPSSYHGSKFNTGKTAIHQLNRSSDSPRVTGNLPGRDDGGAACNKPGQETRNKRSVWTVTTQPYKEAHFATFPPTLITPCILAGCPVGGKVLDCFGGSGTTGEVAESCGRSSILIELNPDYIELAKRRTAEQGLAL